MTIDLLNFDKKYLCEGITRICGIDESGRGPLAGPVVCAAVVMPLDNIIEGINDSKKVAQKNRDILYDLIVSRAICYSVSVVSQKVIDQINILNATKQGMLNALDSLSVQPDIVLVDAVKLDTPKKIVPIIKGDEQSYNIAAASIIAKVTRDRIMVEYDKKYPNYYFSKNKGYGTKEHINAIKTIGLSDIHRLSFVKKNCGGQK